MSIHLYRHVKIFHEYTSLILLVIFVDQKISRPEINIVHQSQSTESPSLKHSHQLLLQIRLNAMNIMEGTSESLLAVKANEDDVHSQSQVESVNCECCGFMEECTLPYISQIRRHYNGRWICGLCVEAVKYEILKSENLITTGEALDRHIDFYENFRSSSRLPFSDAVADHPILAMGKIMRKRLDSPSLRRHRSAPISPD